MGSPQRTHRRRERALSSPRSVGMGATSRRRRHPLQSLRMGRQAHGGARRWQAHSTRHQSPQRGTSPADGGSVTDHSCATSATSASKRRAGNPQGLQPEARAQMAKAPGRTHRRTPTRAATPATAAAANTNRRTFVRKRRCRTGDTAAPNATAPARRDVCARAAPPRARRRPPCCYASSS